jgi:hypothetical protein
MQRAKTLGGALLATILLAGSAGPGSAATIAPTGLRAAANSVDIGIEPVQAGRRGPPGVRRGAPGLRRGPVVAPRRALRPVPGVRRAWRVRPWARRAFFGSIIAGVTLGAIIAVSRAGAAPPPPHPDLCWYWTDWTQTRGYWSYCD